MVQIDPNSPRGASVGYPLGVLTGQWFSRRRAMDQAVEASNPIREGLSQTLPNYQALEQGMLAGQPGPTRAAAERKNQLTAQMTPQQRVLRELTKDPEAFATWFSQVQPENMAKVIQDMAGGQAAPEYGFQNVTGVGLVRTDPRTGTAEPVVRSPRERNTVTISPGQRIIDVASGQTIAEAPRTPELRTISAGQRVVDETGRVVAEAPESSERWTTLTRREAMRRGYPSGAVVQVNDQTGEETLRFEPAPPGEPGVREKKIQDLLRARPELTRGDAAAIVDGQIRMDVSPETGRVTLTDLRSGSAREVAKQPNQGQDPGNAPGLPPPPSGSGAPPAPSYRPETAPEATGGETLYEQAGEGTGLWSALESAGSVVSGTLGGPVAGDTLQARQQLTTATNELVRALAVNPRFPVAEIERIRQEANTLPSVTSPPAVMRERMRSLDASLARRAERAREDAQNVNLPEDVRASQAQNAQAIEAFRQELGVPQGPTRDRAQDTTATGEAGTPPGVPAGSRQIGTTRDGAPVYETPDGTRLVVE